MCLDPEEGSSRSGQKYTCGGCCSRKQIPLCPSYKLTIHKCQGITIGYGQPLTFENLVVELGDVSVETRNPGSDFVSEDGQRITFKTEISFSGQ